MQRLLDVASIPLPTSFCSSLRQVVNILATGKVPASVSRFFAGGSLIAPNKNMEGCPPDNRPIAMGETMQQLGEVYVCGGEDKTAEFFQTLQIGRAGAEKVTHACSSVMP